MYFFGLIKTKLHSSVFRNISGVQNCMTDLFATTLSWLVLPQSLKFPIHVFLFTSVMHCDFKAFAFCMYFISF